MEMLSNILPHNRLSERVPTNRAVTALAPQASSNDISPTECFPLSETGEHQLDATYLTKHRVVAFNPRHRISRAYDMLRNELVGQQPSGSRYMIAVTAPGPGCGTSTTAFNLAFSFARLVIGPIALIEANPSSNASQDLFGMDLPPEHAGKGHHLAIEAAGVRLHLLKPHANAYDYSTGSSLLSEAIEDLTQTLTPKVVILDLPPILHADLTAQMLANVQSTVLVIAANKSTRGDFEVCRTYFQSGQQLQVVLNEARGHGL